MTPLDRLCTNVSQTLLMDDMRVFATRTKLSGSPEELDAFHYLETRMAGLGFRTELILHDAHISLPGPASVVIDGTSLAAISHSFSRPSPERGLQGRLVDIGEGAPAAFAANDLQGAILLVEGIASPAIAARAARAGAVGQLHISPAEHLYEMCISPVWGSPATDAVADLPTTVAATISQADGAALKARLAAGATIQATLHAAVDTGWRKTPILVAELDGPTPTSPFILFSGHHDTWFQGVMDNGGANAVMIEVVRLCAAARPLWHRGLRVCFWSGHSHGRYSGSTWYADRYWDELDRRCAAHVNLDSCGGIGATVLTESGVSAELAALARAAVAGETDQVHAGNRVGRNADQSFFGIGIPAMFGSLSHQPPSPVKMRNALGWWWHTKHDLLDKIDPEFLARDARIALRAVLPLLTDPVLPIDPAAALAALRGHLAPIAPLIDLSPINELLLALEARIGALRRDRADPKLDAMLMRVCRALIPLDGTTGDRFAHDPALPLPAYPALAPLLALESQAPGTDAFHAATVAAIRTRNRLLHALKTAESALPA